MRPRLRRSLDVVWGAAAVLLLTTGCFNLRFKPVSQEERLENQVLTSFDSFGQEVYAMGSVRAVDMSTGKPLPPPPETDSKRRALDAQRSREFNRDDIRDFKNRGLVRENNQGMLEVNPPQFEALKKSDPRQASLVEAVVAEENRDRKTLMERVLETTPALSGESGMREIAKVIAKKNRQDARPGDLIQEDNGDWVQKQAGTASE